MFCVFIKKYKERLGKNSQTNQTKIKKIPRRWAGPDANFSKIFIKWVRID